MMEQQARVVDHEEQEVDITSVPPQIRIYNRYFYLRNARHQDLQDEINRQIQQLASKPKLTPNSYIILVQKLEHQLSSLLQKHIGHQDFLDFQHFQQIFNQFGHFQHVAKEKEQFQVELMVTQLWLILANYDLKETYIQKNKFLSLMHILFCPYMLKPQEMTALIDHAFPNLEQHRSDHIKQFPQSSDQILDTEGITKLWLKIKRTYLCSFITEKKEPLSRQEPSFRPEISMKSRQYAKRQLQKYLSNNRLDNIKNSKLNELSGYISGGKQLSYHELLYKRGLQKQQLLKTSRQRLLDNSDKGKTLTNEQTKKLVENLYIVKQKRDDLDYSKIKEDQELKLCTFRPSIKGYSKQRSTTPTVKNYNKEVDRLEKARKEKLKLQQAYENLGRVKSKPSGPPSMVERDKPKLILQIKVGDRIVQLKLKGDQEPKIVAKKFVTKYGLDESMQQVLESVIQQQLAAL